MSGPCDRVNEGSLYRHVQSLSREPDAPFGGEGRSGSSTSATVGGWASDRSAAGGWSSSSIRATGSLKACWALSIALIAHSENSFTMEGTGVEFVKDSSGAVTAMIQHRTATATATSRGGSNGYYFSSATGTSKRAVLTTPFRWNWTHTR